MSISSQFVQRCHWLFCIFWFIKKIIILIRNNIFVSLKKQKINKETKIPQKQYQNLIDKKSYL